MEIKGWLNRRKEELLDLIYPKICFNCKKHIPIHVEGYLCEECVNKLKKIGPPFCITCGKPIDDLKLNKCAECAGQKYYFSRGFTVSLYEGIIKDCIHEFKYNSQAYLGNTLARLMAGFALNYIPVQKIDLIAPIPLHWLRRRDRGFNQSHILSKYLSKKTGIKLIKRGISRAKTAHSQVDLPREERISNIEGVFKVSKPNLFSRRHILLIDDVFTTGATLNECSKALIESGARDVWIFTLARSSSFGKNNK